MRRGLWPVTAALLLGQTSFGAVTELLTDRDVADALRVANGSVESRSLFHAPYIIAVENATVEHLEVVTEFRRFVLAAEEQLKTGNWMMGRGGYDTKGRTIRDVLRPLAGQVSLRARLRFHPLNNYTALPPVDILLGEPTLLALNVTRTPHITTAPLETQPGGTRDVINGATIEVFYNAPTIDDRVLPVRVLSDGKELLRVSFNFARVQ